MKFISDVITFTKMNIAPNIRSPFTFLAILSIPFVPILFIKIFGVNISHGFIGALVMSVTFTGMGIANDVVLYRRVYRLQDMFVASPTSPLAYMLGLSLSSLILSSPSLAVALAILVIYSGLSIAKLVEVVAIVMLTWIMIVALSFTLATYVESPADVGSLSSFMSIVLGMLPPVYYPLDKIPEPFNYISYLAPTTHSAELLRSAILAEYHLPYTRQLIHWITLLSLTLALILITTKKAQWREK